MRVVRARLLGICGALLASWLAGIPGAGHTRMG